MELISLKQTIPKRKTRVSLYWDAISKWSTREIIVTLYLWGAILNVNNIYSIIIIEVSFRILNIHVGHGFDVG